MCLRTPRLSQDAQNGTVGVGVGGGWGGEGVQNSTRRTRKAGGRTKVPAPRESHSTIDTHTSPGGRATIRCSHKRRSTSSRRKLRTSRRSRLARCASVGDAVVRLTSNFSRHTPLGKFRWSSFQSPLLAAALHLCQAFMRRTSRRTRVVASVTQRWTRLRLVAERRACRLW